MYNLEAVPREALILYIVENIAEALKIKALGFSSVVAIGEKISDKDIEEMQALKRLERVLIIHKNPIQIYQKLSSLYFVKYIIPKRPVSWLTKEEFNETYYFAHRLNRGGKVTIH